MFNIVKVLSAKPSVSISCAFNSWPAANWPPISLAKPPVVSTTAAAVTSAAPAKALLALLVTAFLTPPDIPLVAAPVIASTAPIVIPLRSALFVISS